MRILFFMTHAGHARNFESTLRALGERGHEIIVAVDRRTKKGQANLNDLLDRIAADHRGISIVQTPKRDKTEWSEVGTRLRAAVDYLRYLEPEFAVAEEPRVRAGERVPGPLRRVMNVPLAGSRAGRSRVRGLLKAAEEAVPVTRAVRRFMARIDPDVVLITPLVELGSPQTEYLRCGRSLGVPTALLVASWDNLTLKGLIHDTPQMVAVWNEEQRREAFELHGIPEDRVVITGAFAYDHWLGWAPGSDRATFCERMGLDPGRPIGLYVGSSRFIAAEEASHVVEWANALRDRLPDVQLLIRPHPTNPIKGPKAARLALDRMEDVVIYPSVGVNPTDDESRADYFDSMHHAAFVFGVNTSAFIESTLIGRPVYTVLAERYRGTQGGTLHFRYLLPEHGGPLHTARTWAEHADQVAVAIADPRRALEPNQAFLDSFVYPYGRELPAGVRVADAVELLGEHGVVVPKARSAGRLVAGRGVALAARAVIRHRVRSARALKFDEVRPDADPLHRVNGNGSGPDPEVHLTTASTGSGTDG